MIQCSAVNITNLRNENNFKIVIINVNHPFPPFHIDGKSRFFLSGQELPILKTEIIC